MNQPGENETDQLVSQTATWDPVKFDLAFKGRRLISFDELYKYYRYDGVKSRITRLSYDPWDGLKIAFVLTGLMALIAFCMVACHYRERARQRVLARQTAVWSAIADAADAEEVTTEAAAEQDQDDPAAEDSRPLRPNRSASLRSNPVTIELPPNLPEPDQLQRPLRRESSIKVHVHFHRGQFGGGGAGTGGGGELAARGTLAGQQF